MYTLRSILSQRNLMKSVQLLPWICSNLSICSAHLTIAICYSIYHLCSFAAFSCQQFVFGVEFHHNSSTAAQQHSSTAVQNIFEGTCTIPEHSGSL